MRYTKKVSMWPVGLITKYGVSSPIVRNGTISGFYDGWIGGRKFPVDMAGKVLSSFSFIFFCWECWRGGLTFDRSKEKLRGVDSDGR
jgi:hypothetical protein